MDGARTVCCGNIIVSTRNYNIEYKIVYNFGHEVMLSFRNAIFLTFRTVEMATRSSTVRGNKPAAPKRKLVSTQAVVRDVRDRIASQSLLPGSRIPEEDLAQHYGITRAKAREVLATLEDRGLVERVPNKGAVVVPVDMQTTYRLYEVREALDGLSVRLAMKNARSEDWKELQQWLGPPFEESLRNGDIEGHVDTIMRFRYRITELAGNPILSDLIERIYERTRVTMRRVAVLPGRAEAGIKQYRELLAAMMRGDADAAERCVRELNSSAREYILRYKEYL